MAKQKKLVTETLVSSDEAKRVENAETGGGHRGRGFASMSPEKRREMGSKGGKTAHARGTANKFTTETASLAGKISHVRGTAHVWTTEDARKAGRKGGAALREKRAKDLSSKTVSE